MNDPAFSIEINRLAISQSTDARTKSQLGQFFTPASTAQFMAELFPESSVAHCKLLDAGAGIGCLAHAFLARHAHSTAFERVDVTSFEIDTRIHEALNQSLKEFKIADGLKHFDYKICSEDFIEQSVNQLQFESCVGYTHAILNPPYKKISSNSRHRLLLRKVGVETVNLYAAFVALAILQMASDGLLVAIIPRSFCNGPYYLPFRKLILKEASIERIHLFESRNQAFKDDSVLQENIIIVLKRHGKQNNVVISTSKDDTFKNLEITTHPFEKIVNNSDTDIVIHIPTTTTHLDATIHSDESFSLSEIGIQVSTGPVVDFRLKSHLRAQSEPNCVPLLYPCHFSNLRKQCEWPKENSKKANAIQYNSDTEK
jgi:adenine-specific DNA-methyltransferase